MVARKAANRAILVTVGVRGNVRKGVASIEGRYKDLELLAPVDRGELERWFALHHADREKGAWVKFAKKNSGCRSASYVEAREVAIRYGWIDGLKNALDATHYLLRFTPRRPRGKWSLINREIAEDLIAAGRMEPAGMAQVEAARADGRWANAYPPPSRMKVPTDLARAIEADASAKRFFDNVSGANRFAILYRVHDATQPEKRRRVIADIVAMLARGEVFHPDA